MLLLSYSIPMGIVTMLRNLIVGACKTIMVLNVTAAIYMYVCVCVRGVILYAMVCGRLPFGDDSQVKKQQKNGLSFPSSRTITRQARKLITGILNPSVDDRFDTYDIILHDWTASQPVKAPQPLNSKPKYTLENCLSLVYQTKIDHGSGPGRLPGGGNNQSSGATRTRVADNIYQSSAPPPGQSTAESIAQ